MDFLNQAFSQLRDLFRSMTPGTRITAALLLVVVVVSLGYLVTTHASGPGIYLMGGESFPPSRLPAMEAAFAKADLSSYEIEGNRIRIPRGQQAAYIGALAEANALPPSFHSYLDATLENDSPFLSRHQQEERRKNAKEKELALIISSLEGIESAAVLYDQQTKSGLRRETITTATATVWPGSSQQLDAGRVAAIRYLLAGAIAGLRPEGVTVVNGVTGRVRHAGDPESSGNGGPAMLAELQERYEHKYKHSILEALAYVPGVAVTANVVLDPERVSRSTKRTLEAKPVVVHEREESRTHSQEGGGAAGVPGPRSNMANQPQSLGPVRGGGNKQDEETSKRETTSFPSHEEIEKETTGYTPQRVTASIGIPASYFENIWRKAHAAEEGSEPPKPDQTELDKTRTEETAKIQKHVAMLLPPAEGVDDPLELVNVSVFPDLPTEKPPAPGMGQRAMVWFGQSWGTLGMIALTLFSLVMLRSMVRSTPSSPPNQTEGPNIVPFEANDTDATTAAVKAQRLARFSGSGPSLRDEVTELVQEDPDAAANILKTWIGNAG